MPFISEEALERIRNSVRETLDRECLCEGKPFYPSESQYNPACPCHQEVE